MKIIGMDPFIMFVLSFIYTLNWVVAVRYFLDTVECAHLNTLPE
jgi:hypothetical protein